LIQQHIHLNENIPVSLIRGRDIWRMTPLTHLQYSYKKQWVDAKYARRNCDTQYLPSTPGSIAEVICIWKGLQTAVESRGPLNCKIRKDPVS